MAISGVGAIRAIFKLRNPELQKAFNAGIEVGFNESISRNKTRTDSLIEGIELFKAQAPSSLTSIIEPVAYGLRQVLGEDSDAELANRLNSLGQPFERAAQRYREDNPDASFLEAAQYALKSTVAPEGLQEVLGQVWGEFQFRISEQTRTAIGLLLPELIEEPAPQGDSVAAGQTGPNTTTDKAVAASPPQLKDLPPIDFARSFKKVPSLDLENPFAPKKGQLSFTADGTNLGNNANEASGNTNKGGFQVNNSGTVNFNAADFVGLFEPLIALLTGDNVRANEAIAKLRQLSDKDTKAVEPKIDTPISDSEESIKASLKRQIDLLKEIGSKGQIVLALSEDGQSLEVTLPEGLYDNRAYIFNALEELSGGQLNNFLFNTVPGSATFLMKLNTIPGESRIANPEALFTTLRESVREYPGLLTFATKTDGDSPRVIEDGYSVVRFAKYDPQNTQNGIAEGPVEIYSDKEAKEITIKGLTPAQANYLFSGSSVLGSQFFIPEFIIQRDERGLVTVSNNGRDLSQVASLIQRSIAEDGFPRNESQTKAKLLAQPSDGKQPAYPKAVAVVKKRSTQIPLEAANGPYIIYLSPITCNIELPGLNADQVVALSSFLGSVEFDQSQDLTTGTTTLTLFSPNNEKRDLLLGRLQGFIENNSAFPAIEAA
jgi:hypothetical protein